MSKCRIREKRKNQSKRNICIANSVEKNNTMIKNLSLDHRENN